MKHACGARGSYRILVGNPSEKRPLVRLSRWEDNIKMDIREVGCERGKWMELAQDCVWWRTLMCRCWIGEFS